VEDVDVQNVMKRRALPPERVVQLPKSGAQVHEGDLKSNQPKRGDWILRGLFVDRSTATTPLEPGIQ
jgi:hypothetical protein